MIVGVTGGIGAGKSTVVNIFKEYGWHTIDADKICHSLYDQSDSDILKKLIRRWGKSILLEDGTLNRQQVAEIIFNDEKEREWLDSIIHPAVLKQGLDLHQSFNKENSLFDLPLLFEVGWDNQFDSIISVWTEKSIVYERLINRGMSIDDIEKRIQAQLSPEIKIEKSDFTIINNGNLITLRKQCEKIINKFEI